MTTGWMLRSSCERDWARISPAINRRYLSSVWINASSRRTQHDHARRPIATFLVLCPTEFDHIFRGRVSDVDLAKDRISVVCETKKEKRRKKGIIREKPQQMLDGRHSHNASHRVKNHLQHGFGT